MSVDLFLRGLGREPPVLSDEQHEALEAELRGQLERGRAAQAGITVDDAEVVAVLAEIVGSDAAACADVDACRRALEAIPAGDVVLGVACARGDETALARFREQHLGSVPGVARRVGTSDADTADVVSRVAEALLVAAPGARPRILDLVGRGSLAGLVRVIAVRTALNLGRGERRQLADPHDALATAIASQTDPELATIKARHRDAIKAALEAAVATLPADERNLLRLSLLHRLGIDEIAALQRVHRSTAARRLARIREALGKEARRRLRVELGPTESDLDHVYHLVRSSLDLSFDRLLDARP